MTLRVCKSPAPAVVSTPCDMRLSHAPAVASTDPHTCRAVVTPRGGAPRALRALAASQAGIVTSRLTATGTGPREQTSYEDRGEAEVSRRNTFAWRQLPTRIPTLTLGLGRMLRAGLGRPATSAVPESARAARQRFKRGRKNFRGVEKV